MKSLRDKKLAFKLVNDLQNMNCSDKRVKPSNGNGHALSLKDLFVQLPILHCPAGSGPTQYKLVIHLEPAVQHALTWRLLILSNQSKMKAMPVLTSAVGSQGKSIEAVSPSILKQSLSCP